MSARYLMMLTGEFPDFLMMAIESQKKETNSKKEEVLLVRLIWAIHIHQLLKHIHRTSEHGFPTRV